MAKKYILITLLLAITIYTRFLNLNWDSGWGLHPDENNLWGASRQIKLFSKLDPNFYAYGGFPIYLYSLFDNKVQARAVSAGVQTAIVLLLFFLGKKIAGWPGGIFSGFMATFSAGLVQAAHFLTVESFLGIFGLLIILGLVEGCEPSAWKIRWKVRNLSVAASIALGIGVGTKISFLVFVLPFLIVLRSDLWLSKAGPLKALLKFAGVTFLALSTFLLTNHYIIDRWESVRGTLMYEANVATGTLPVFYTREFIDTIPGWFQTIHVFPYITGWMFIPVFLIGLFVALTKARPCHSPRPGLIILLLSCLSALLSFLPLFAKWTRYVVQVLPLLILIAGIGASWLWRRGLLERIFVAAAMITFLPPFFSMLSVYQNQDTRLTAVEWAASHIDGQAKIFTEAMDLGIIPFNPSHGSQSTLINFYELDEDGSGKRQEELQQSIERSDYFISVSERVYRNSLRRPDLFPRSAAFYRSLFDGSLGFQKIYESRNDNCSPFTAHCSLLTAPEETFSVFDHPKVMIFLKEKNLY